MVESQMALKTKQRNQSSINRTLSKSNEVLSAMYMKNSFALFVSQATHKPLPQIGLA